MEWYVQPGVGLEQQNGATLTKSRTRTRTRILIFNCTSGRSGLTLLGKIKDTIVPQLAKYSTPDNSNVASIDPEKFFDRVIFCPAITYADGTFKSDLSSALLSASNLKDQHELKSAFLTLFPSFSPDQISVLPTIQHAIELVRSETQKSQSESASEGESSVEEQVDVLVTGSLHLVGGVIEVAGLEKEALRV
jgi:folylpolyglutamate synthase